MLVSLPEGRGIGKLDGVDGGLCSVSVFHSIVRSETTRFPATELQRAYLSPQTRVYVRDDEGFRVGRVVDFLTSAAGLVDYEVRFPNGRRADFSELALFVRPWSAPEDPAEVMASGGAESQFLHDRRQAAMSSLLRLRSAAQGLTALVSASIDLVPHQVAAVRRVLTDPVQRFMLADEVGLGKTIEAGLIIRQHLIDNADTAVLVAVPSHLCEQWRAEFRTKLRLDQFDSLVEVIAHADLARVRHTPDVLVVDEAHHLVGTDTGPLAPAAAQLRKLAEEAQVVLLLSATPALGDEVRFLALLNLLDPGSHPPDDVSGFRRKLEGRREIGRLLLALDPNAPKLVLRQRGSELERLFPDDPIVAQLAPQLVAATHESPDEVPKLCAALKAHVADSYRIHQRLIRSRRADAQGWEFAARGPADNEGVCLSHVRLETDESNWAEALSPIIEEWRFAAVEAAAGDVGALDLAALRYAGLLAAVAGGRGMLLAWIHEAVERTTFAEEPDILGELRLLAETTETDDGVATASESARRLFRNLKSEGITHPKVVAFASQSANARALWLSLSDTVEGCEVLLFAGGEAERDATSITRFKAPRTAAVLICDESGEEGLNLACADAIVHLDLPMSAARIEQRIGRLDRFGRRKGRVRHRIVLPVDEDDSPWTGWFEFLAHGLAIFHRSISDIQFLLDGFERQLFRGLLEQGPQTVPALSTKVLDAIREERRSQDEQYALDRIALDEEPVEKLIDALDDAEEDEGALEESVDRWWVGALQLRKRPFAWPEADPFKLSSTKDTLIPRLPWLERLNSSGDGALTWRRRVATAHPEAVLLRPGTPLVDMTERFTRWDDRGTAFITWRSDPTWHGELWLGFRLCFVVEPNLSIADLLAPSRKELALIRRAQRFLQPQSHVVHVDADGDLVTDTALLDILSRPYQNNHASGGRGTDINLASRSQLLANVIDQARFAVLCRSVRDVAQDRLVAEPRLKEAISEAKRLLALEIERRRNRLHRRQLAGDAAAEDDLHSIQAILPAIAEPAVRLDAMGCFIVSRDRPAAYVHD